MTLNSRLRAALAGTALAAVGLVLGTTAISAVGANDDLAPTLLGHHEDGEHGEVHRFVGNLDVHSGVVTLDDDAGELEVDLPDHSTVRMALLRWVGVGPEWDDTAIRLDGSSISADRTWTADAVGLHHQTNVADVTEALDLEPGTNRVDVSEIDRSSDDLLVFASLVVVIEDVGLPEVALTIVEEPDASLTTDSALDGPGRLRVHETEVCADVAPATSSRQAVAGWRTSDSTISSGPESVELHSPDSTLVSTRTGFGQGVFLTGEFARPRDAAFGFAPSVGTVPAGADRLCLQSHAITIDADEYAGILLSEAWFAVPTVHRVGDLVFLDGDGDGVADATEPGIARVRVELRDGVTDALIDTTTTDAEGRWAFEGLVAGRYRISVPKEQVGEIGDETIDLADAGTATPTEENGVDNDNDAFEESAAFVSGLVRLGDEGLDGDFANFASREPTSEEDRVTGNDADPADVELADGDYDDVRSDLTIDIGIVPPAGAGSLADGDPFVAGQLHSNTVEVDGVEIDYMVATPEGFEAGDEAPVIVAFPPSSQSFDRVTSSMATTWGPEALERGFVVISPAAPDEVRWFEGSEDLLPGFVDWLGSWVEPEDDAVHFAGYSNGGISAFRAAALLPESTRSVVGFPGYALSNDDRDALATLAELEVPVRMYLGGDESDTWVERATLTRDLLEAAEGDVGLVTVPDEPHVIAPLMDGSVVFNLLEEIG